MAHGQTNPGHPSEEVAISKRVEVRVNEQIRAPRVRLIAADGKQIGIVTTKEALLGAQEENLDLVEVAPDADPPVCRIMDYGKLRYQSTKKTKGKTKSQHLKEIKLRPLTAEHDVGVKVRNMRRFLSGGDKVKVSMIFRGRERFHTELGLNLLNEIIKQIEDIGTVEAAPKMQGRDLSMFIVPKSGG